MCVCVCVCVYEKQHTQEPRWRIRYGEAGWELPGRNRRSIVLVLFPSQIAPFVPALGRGCFFAGMAISQNAGARQGRKLSEEQQELTPAPHGAWDTAEIRAPAEKKGKEVQHLWRKNSLITGVDKGQTAKAKQLDMYKLIIHTSSDSD